MIGRIKRKVNEVKFRFKLRQALQEESTECLYWTLDEARKEIERRNKQCK